jgi:hypothetical protein
MTREGKVAHMIKSAAGKHKGNLRDRYLDGSISVNEYVDRLLNSKEGDRNRRKIEQKHNSIFNKSRSTSKY